MELRNQINTKNQGWNKSYVNNEAVAKLLKINIHKIP